MNKCLSKGTVVKRIGIVGAESPGRIRFPFLEGPRSAVWSFGSRHPTPAIVRKATKPHSR